MLNKIIYTILGIGLTLIFFPRVAKDHTREAIVSGTSIEYSETKLKPAPELAINLSAPKLSAAAALGYDLDSGMILYSKNLDEKFPIASLTKLTTALVVVKNRNLDEVVTVGEEIKGVVGSTIGLVPGEKITVENLLKAMLIPSSNDAALSLGNFVGGNGEGFVRMMNEEAKTLGLTATNFTNPVGWDLGENYSNTLDLIKVTKEFLKHPKLVEIVGTKEAVIWSTDKRYYHELTTTNKLLLENSKVIGIKTGFTSKAQGNLIILANHNDRKIVTIVLGSIDREADSQNLLDWILKAYRW